MFQAVKRIQERNNLSEEEAVKRISSQPTNSEQLEISNVVFCTLWTPGYTEKQVRRAWIELQDRLLDDNPSKSDTDIKRRRSGDNISGSGVSKKS